jgi:hypothetical protein
MMRISKAKTLVILAGLAASSPLWEDAAHASELARARLIQCLQKIPSTYKLNNEVKDCYQNWLNQIGQGSGGTTSSTGTRSSSSTRSSSADEAARSGMIQPRKTP